jgi:hypothetical protein
LPRSNARILRVEGERGYTSHGQEDWMERRVAFLVGTLGIVAVAGCAFGDRHVALVYPPPAAQVAAPPPRRPAPTTAAVALQNFADLRSKAPIGEVSNGFGMHTADVLAQGNVAQWVTEAVAYELRAAGLRVHRLYGQRPTPGEMVISGQIVNFYCRAMLSYQAEVSFIGQVAIDNQVGFTGHLSGNGGAGVNLGMTEASYGESLAAALQDAVRKFVAQIYPIVTRPIPPPPAPTPPEERAAAPQS